jgi:hypothetical protein
MLNAQDEINNALQSGNKIVSKTAQEYVRLKNLNEERMRSAGKDIEMQMKRNSNAERITSISQKWNVIMEKLAYIFLPIIDNVLGFVADNFNVVVAGALALGTYLKYASVGIQGFGFAMGLHVGKALNLFNLLWGGIRSVVGIFKTLETAIVPLKAITSIFSSIGTFIGKLGFLKILTGPIGWIITGVTFLWQLFKRFDKIEFIDGDWTGNIVKGISAIGGAILDTLLAPFKMAWDYIKPWLGQSPSQLGLGILNGIQSISSMLFDSIISPFRDAFRWITTNIPFMGKLANMIGIGNGFENSMNIPKNNFSMDIGRNAAQTFLPPMTISPQPIPVNQEVKSVPTTNETNTNNILSLMTDMIKSNNETRDEVKGLRHDFATGTIRAETYMDSQLVSATIDRQSQFRNGYGVNHIS